MLWGRKSSPRVPRAPVRDPELHFPFDPASRGGRAQNSRASSSKLRAPGRSLGRELTCAIHESVSEKTRRRPLLTSEFSQNALRSSSPPIGGGRIRKPSRSLRCAGAVRMPGDVPAKRHTRVDYKKKSAVISIYYGFENEGHGRIPSGSDSSIRVRVGRDVRAPPNSSGRGSMYERRRCRCSCSSGSES